MKNPWERLSKKPEVTNDSELRLMEDVENPLYNEYGKMIAARKLDLFRHLATAVELSTEGNIAMTMFDVTITFGGVTQTISLDPDTFFELQFVFDQQIDRYGMKGEYDK